MKAKLKKVSILIVILSEQQYILHLEIVKIVKSTGVTEVLETLPSPTEKDVSLVRNVHKRIFLSFARTCRDLRLQDHHILMFYPLQECISVLRGFCHW